MACITRIDCDPAVAQPVFGLGQTPQGWHAALNVAKAAGKSLSEIPANDPDAPDTGPDDTPQPLVGLAKGTLIDTLDGPKPVEDLKPRDVLRTGSGRCRLVHHILRIDRGDAIRHAMIRIKAGALGPNLPARNMRLPRNQKILVRSEIAQRMFGQDGSLVAARFLTDLPDVTKAKPRHCPGALYLLLLETQDTILADGIPIETLAPCAENLALLPAHLRTALARMYPGFAQASCATALQVQAARPKRQKRLIKRHIHSGSPLIVEDPVEQTAEAG